jgi:4-amino-4-deoxy-L-arabinose transferase-like glycosyltransferase
MKKIILLFLIISLALFLRLYKVTSIPVSLSWDEAAVGYNAYSILKTGKDEWGKTLPLVFKSFGDYKSPLFVYLLVPFVYLFGLTEFAVRFPAAVLGTITVLFTYLLTKNILNLKKFKKNSDSISLLAALLMAVSPWHLRFSRVGFEPVIALFFQTLALLCFFKAFKNKKYLYISAISFAASTYTYHVAKFYLPILILGLLLVFRKKIFENIKHYILCTLILLILTLPNFLLTFSEEGTSRGSGTLITNDAENINITNELYAKDLNQGRRFLGINNHNKVFIARTFLENYIKHFSPRFLFFGDTSLNWRLNLKNVGMMYYIDLPFLLIGIFLFVKEKKLFQLFILYWFFTSPVISSMTIESPHSLRSLNILPAPIILASYGLIYVLKKARFKKLIVSTVILVYIFNFAYFQYFYFQLYPVISDIDWQYPIKKVLNYAFEQESHYDKIIITDTQTYIYYLFYKKYDPLAYQTVPDQDKRKRIGQYEFKKIDWQADIMAGRKTLVVSQAANMNNQAKPEKVFYYMNGEPAFFAYEFE